MVNDNDVEKRAFRNEVSGYLAIYLESALERLVRAGRKLIGKIPKADKKILLEALENKSVSVIHGILRTLNPDVTENIQGIDERIIWRIFWDLRSDQTNADISIFALLGEINSNPPLAAVPA